MSNMEPDSYNQRGEIFILSYVDTKQYYLQYVKTKSFPVYMHIFRMKKIVFEYYMYNIIVYWYFLFASSLKVFSWQFFSTSIILFQLILSTVDFLAFLHNFVLSVYLRCLLMIVQTSFIHFYFIHLVQIFYLIMLT